MQSLPEVEPVVLGSSLEGVSDLFGQTEEMSGFVPPPDSNVAEKFRLAMAEPEGYAAEDLPKPTGRVVPDAPKSKDGVFRRFDANQPGKSTHDVEDVLERAVRTVDDLSDVVIPVAENLPENNEREVDGLSQAPICVAKNLPEEALSTVKDSHATKGRIVSDALKTDDTVFRHLDANLSSKSTHAVEDVPENTVRTFDDLPGTPIRVAKSTLRTADRVYFDAQKTKK